MNVLTKRQEGDIKRLARFARLKIARISGGSYDGGLYVYNPKTNFTVCQLSDSSDFNAMQKMLQYEIDILKVPKYVEEMQSIYNVNQEVLTQQMLDLIENEEMSFETAKRSIWNKYKDKIY